MTVPASVHVVATAGDLMRELRLNPKMELAAAKTHGFVVLVARAQAAEELVEALGGLQPVTPPAAEEGS